MLLQEAVKSINANRKATTCLDRSLFPTAIARRDEYTSKIREARKLSSDRESRKKILRAAVEWAKGLGDKLREKSEKTAQTCSAAMWQASHNGDHVAQGQNFARLSNYED
ncbi:hypothetical protein [Pseudanabaena mucicola]|uniref:hypothetical protein n=1 Tax=Pseudanabaena mucicola TaxID=71190 RepID=UPI0025778A17|nr:hypothetical protein [Pseudanabaena mucicola]